MVSNKLKNEFPVVENRSRDLHLLSQSYGCFFAKNDPENDFEIRKLTSEMDSSPPKYNRVIL